MDAVLLKAAARGREVQERREAERRRALLVLVLRHLTDQGYIDAADRLSAEANVSLANHDAADNISLVQILQDFEEEHEQRYGRRPKLIKSAEVCCCCVNVHPSMVPMPCCKYSASAPKCELDIMNDCLCKYQFLCCTSLSCTTPHFHHRRRRLVLVAAPARSHASPVNTSKH